MHHTRLENIRVGVVKTYHNTSAIVIWRFQSFWEQMAVFSKPAKAGQTGQRLLHLTNAIDVLDEDLLPETREILQRFQRLTGWTLRNWQKQGVDSLFRGHDLFVKAGTGAGKSMVFLAMIEAILNGIVLVLCPLLSLMHDQVYPQTRFLIVA